MYQNIERCCQLHETVEIVYVVDGYEARFLTGEKLVVEVRGPTVEEALRELDRCLAHVTLEEVRSVG